MPAKSLGKRDYHRILVGGYPGIYGVPKDKAPTCEVYYAYASGAQTKIDMKANDMLRWYDSVGKLTGRPKGR
jgi:hypothetical protein